MSTETSKQWAILTAVVVTQCAVPFMLSAVGVCLPSIGRDLGATAIQLTLVESVFLAVNAMFLLPLGRAADILGRGGVFLAGLAIFTASSLSLAFAPDMAGFLALRAVQGFGGAMTLATGLALLYDAFPPQTRGRALGISVAGIYLGISGGPFLGGVITTHLGWRWVFYLGMLPCLVSLAICLRNLDWRLRPKPGERFDWTGAVLCVVCIGLLTYGSAHTESMAGWMAMAGGAATLAAFLLVERASQSPLLDLRLFVGNRAFSLGMAAMFLIYSSAFGASFLLSLYLQYGRNMNPSEAGLLLAFQPLVQCLVSPFTGRLSDRLPVHLMAGSGALFVAAGLLLASTLDAGSGQGTVIAVLAVVGLGIGLFAAPNMAGVMSGVAPQRYGVASALTGQTRTLGMTCGMVLITLVISHFVGNRPLGAEVFAQYHTAMRLLLTLFGCTCLFGSMLAFLGAAKPHAARSQEKP